MVRPVFDAPAKKRIAQRGEGVRLPSSGGSHYQVWSFYPRRPDGSALAFSVADIDSDTMAALFARQLFAIHQTAVLIEVFEGDQFIRQYLRDEMAVAEG